MRLFYRKAKMKVKSSKMLFNKELGDKNSQREIDGYTITNCINCKIITFNQSLQLKERGINIDVIPAWRYALT